MKVNAKKFITLNKKIENLQSKALKFESGYNYSPIKYNVLNNKVNILQEMQNNIPLSNEDKNEISFYYECEMF